MASKSKKRSKARSAVISVDRAKRNLERGDFKQALKDVRVCYRQNPTSDCRCFLEHAYIGRAQQLVRTGLIEDSRRILQDLLDLGVTEPAVKAALPDLLLSVGMFDRLPEGDALTDKEQDRLRIKAADQAVTHPGNTPKSMSKLQDDASRIRSALEFIEQGDESAALEHLRDIPRQSLFADWKYFVRGLIAYYRHDKESMTANWGRLDADRAATRIAAPLQVVAGTSSVGNDDALRAKVSRLENSATGGAVLGKVTQLRKSAAEHDWPMLLKILRSVRRPLRDTNEGISRRLDSCLCQIFVSEGLLEELEQLARIVDPAPSDPRWNRAKAVACECSEHYDDEPEEYWLEYLQDLESLPTLSSTQRELARGLVWLRLADSYAEDANHWRNCRCNCDHGSTIQKASKQALDAFEQCIAIAPTYAPAYLAAGQFHSDADRPEEAVKLCRRLLERVPDDLESLMFLATHYLSHGKGLKARELALRAHELKPLSPQTRELLWSSRSEAARELAQAEQFDEARAEMAAADQLLPARKNDYDALARKAVLEIKADNPGAARRFVEQAQEQLHEPTALWLAMTIEAIRHDLPWQEACLYEKRWIKALKRRCRSETAGLMCHLLDVQLQAAQSYPQHKEHTGILLQYVGRCSRVKWQEEDLRRVCELLEQVQELELLAKFAQKGTRKFPKEGCFHWLIAMTEVLNKTKQHNRWSTTERLERAIELASDSSDPRDKLIVEHAKKCLAMVEKESYHHDAHADDEDDEDSEEGFECGFDGLTDDPAFDGVKKAIQSFCDKQGLDYQTVLNDIMSGRMGKPAGLGH